jgi:LysM repeat protein
MAKLTITKCKVSGGQVQEQRGQNFSAAINPADYKHGFSISYFGERPTDPKAIGKSGVTTRFSAIDSETVAFTIVLDGTGVVEDAKGKSVADQLKALKGVCYEYDGALHQSNVVKLSWGKGLAGFFCRLNSMDVEYTLFRASGEALRAKVQLKFVSYETPEEEAAKARRSSPDLTHHVTVRAGDTLPLLCARIYQDPSRYREVAAWNGLDGFRDLKPGTELAFPPLR